MPENVPYGYCHCGCGQRTRLAKATARSRGRVQGEPSRYLPGHNNRLATLYSVDKTTGCWVWTGRLQSNGYPTIRRGSTTQRAHRWLYELAVSPIPEGMQLDHLCSNRACVNPEHLEVVTQAENIRRGAHTKLTWTDVEAIRASSDRQITLAQRYGVHRDTIRRIRAGLRWQT